MPQYTVLTYKPVPKPVGEYLQRWGVQQLTSASRSAACAVSGICSPDTPARHPYSCSATWEWWRSEIHYATREWRPRASGPLGQQRHYYSSCRGLCRLLGRTRSESGSVWRPPWHWCWPGHSPSDSGRHTAPVSTIVPVATSLFSALLANKLKQFCM